MERRLLAALAFCLLAATAGCAGVFGGGISDERLDQPPPREYDWNTSRDVTVYVYGNGTYQAVYDLGNTTELELFKRGLGNDRALSIRSVRYRYPNGTVVNGSSDAVSIGKRGNRRLVEFPETGDGAMFAYTSDSGVKEFGMPSYKDGSYEVVLPPGHRTKSLLFAEVDPRGYETTVDDRDRLHIVWADVKGTVYVQYYLARDRYIFWGLVAVMTVVAGIGTLYFYVQIRRLEKKREEMGLDVDLDDGGGRDPPPGMR